MHYMVPPIPRLPDALPLIEEGQYFVVHAPRQTGKTTTLRALANKLNEDGEYAAVHFSCEVAEPAGDDYVAAQKDILGELRWEVGIAGLRGEDYPPLPWPEDSEGRLLGAALSAWAVRCPKPLVLFFDEIDALRGESLRSVLRQLRAGFASRPRFFPHSVVLCGLRDVRDYKAASGGDPNRLGTSSPFNIKVTSMRLGDFTADEVAALYDQHTVATGQQFTGDAVQRAFECTQGQPWLTNALGYEIIRRMRIEPPVPITADHIDTAKERLIRDRATHLDSLASKLQEARVRQVLQPLLTGEPAPPDIEYTDSVSYVRDLGLIARTKPVRMANPIYNEVVARVLKRSESWPVEVPTGRAAQVTPRPQRQAWASRPAPE